MGSTLPDPQPPANHLPVPSRLLPADETQKLLSSCSGLHPKLPPHPPMTSALTNFHPLQETSSCSEVTGQWLLLSNSEDRFEDTAAANSENSSPQDTNTEPQMSMDVASEDSYLQEVATEAQMSMDVAAHTPVLPTPKPTNRNLQEYIWMV